MATEFKREVADFGQGKKTLGYHIHCDKHMACMLTRDNYVDVDLLSITTNPFLYPGIKALYYCKVQR
jgi:hypothetical protein